MQKKIIFISTNPLSGKGGIASAVKNSIDILTKNGCPHEVFISHQPHSDVLRALVVFFQTIVRIIKSDAKNTVFFLHVGPKGSLVRKLFLAILIKIKGGAVVSQYHSPIFYNYLKGRSFWLFPLKCLVLFSDKNLALNEYWRRVFSNTLGAKFFILANPISNHPLKHKNLHHEGVINVSCVARLVKEKNVQEVIKLAKLDNRLMVSVVGDGPFRKNIEDLIEKNKVTNRVKLFGWLSNEEVIRLISASDVFILPSKYDSFGMVYVEALCTGTPVIAPKLRPVMETLKNIVGVKHVDDAGNMSKEIDELLRISPGSIRKNLLIKYGEGVYLKSLQNILYDK